MIKVYFFDNDNDTSKAIETLIGEYEDEKIEFLVINDFKKFITEFTSDEKAIFFIDMRSRIKNINCFKLAGKIRQKNELCHLIFTSHYHEDMCFCFKNLLRPTNFLTKPIAEYEYKAQIDMIIKSNIERDAMSHHKMQISSGGTKYILTLDEIVYFSTLGKKIVCKTMDGKEIEFYDTMKSLEAKLSNYFIRCHSGFLINKEIISRTNNNMLLIKNSRDMIPISKKYKKTIAEYLKTI